MDPCEHVLSQPVHVSFETTQVDSVLHVDFVTLVLPDKTLKHMLAFEIERLVVVVRRVKLEVVHVQVVYFHHTYQLEVALTLLTVLRSADLEDAVEVVLSDQSKPSLICIAWLPLHAREDEFDHVLDRAVLPLSVYHIVW